jgi:hypothetical protein
MKRSHLLIILALVLALTPFTYLRWHSNRRIQGHNAYLCVDNLRVIDATKEVYAHDHGLKTGDVVSTQVLAELRAWPKTCPSGGTYSINPVGTPPTCSVPGHRIPGT